MAANATPTAKYRTRNLTDAPGEVAGQWSGRECSESKTDSPPKRRRYASAIADRLHVTLTAVLVRSRPRVMISSTITELLGPRAAIEARLSTRGLADGWLFEIHASAAGAAAEEQYLDIARSCDIYVIVVAQQSSAATALEYYAAFEDNPRKILAFYVGLTTADTQDLRSLIDSRHSRVVCSTEVELVDAVVGAIERAVETGELARPALVAEVDDRLRRAEAAVTQSPPVSFIPHVTAQPMTELGPGQLSQMPVSVAVVTFQRLLLEGIGGSGKTYASLAAARSCAEPGRMPLVVTPRPGELDMLTLLTAAFDSVGFFPGNELIREFLREGALVVVADGIDALASEDRRIFMEGLESFARTAPRCHVICSVRRSLQNELPTFTKSSLDPLAEDQIRDMFSAVGVPQIHSFPSQVEDLARWPLWAWALIEVGSDAETGLVLLQRLIDHRIAVSGAYTPIEAELLHEAAAALAYAAWPQPIISATDALSTLDDFAGEERTKRRYKAPPSATILERLSGAGILQHGPTLSLAHPLFATYLAARQATTNGMSPEMRADPEFAMFVAALLPRQRDPERLQLLVAHGPIGQARFLRLVPALDRQAAVADGAQFGAAVKQLSGIGATCLVKDEWTAWRETDQPGVVPGQGIATWLSERQEIVFMKGNAFETRSPVELATLESLSRYKSIAQRLEPGEQRWYMEIPKPVRQDLRKLSRKELDERLLQAATDWRRHWREFTQALGIEPLPEARLPSGEPEITLELNWPNPRYDIEWGPTAKVVRVAKAGDSWRLRPLGQLLQPRVTAYRELIDITERALGCRFSSQAWSRPEHVAAWAW